MMVNVSNVAWYVMYWLSFVKVIVRIYFYLKRYFGKKNRSDVNKV